ncbi:MAG: GNAT family N-acetyltransferase [Firmicutes bacterium]|nr:GNAT family N-acetyltransferase [Bacillota bacterium]
MGPIVIAESVNAQDVSWIQKLWSEEWGGAVMVSKGVAYRLDDLEMRLAWIDGMRVGLITWHKTSEGSEVMSLNALCERKGVGSALLQAVEDDTRYRGGARCFLITSNDNLDALRFYQRRGYRIIRVDPGAVDEARRIKPSIPLFGQYGIPIHDELELEKRWG